QLMYEYPNANTNERVKENFQILKESNEPNINNKASDNTNVAKACYSNTNRDDKFLSLENAILM
ncbi:6025_t:CDS:2, partial [Racocetra persica]